MAKRLKDCGFKEFKRAVKRNASNLGITVEFVPPEIYRHCGLPYKRDIEAARKMDKSGQSSRKQKTCVMSDGVVLTESQISEQLRITMKESTSGWNPTSVKSVILIMHGDGLSQKTKALAEDCLMKFIFETCGHKLSDAVSPRALRKMFRRTPKERLIGFVTQCVNAFDLGIEVKL